MRLAKHIFVIEDEKQISDLLVQILELEGYRVTCAGNGQDALELLELPELPALIVTDLDMPIMDGFEFLRAIQENPLLCQIPTMVLSASESMAQAERNQIATAFIKKPLDLNRFLASVERLSHVRMPIDLSETVSL